MTEQNTRRKERVSVEGVSGSVMFAFDIRVLNVSVDGAAFQTMKRLDINKVYLLKLSCGKQQVSVRGEIMWCTLSGSAKTPEGEVAPVYTMGMRFVQEQDASLGTLRQFVEQQQQEELLFRHIRVGLTLHPGTGNELTISTRYPAKRLQLNEIVIEADTDLGIDTRVQLDIHLTEGLIIYPAGTIVATEKEVGKGHRTTIALTNITHKDEACIRHYLEGPLPG